MSAGAALALASAAAYGVSDFAGGLLARRIDLRVVAVVGQVGGLVVALAAAPLFPGHWDGASMLWGAVSGMGTGMGMLFLFRGLSRGAMSTVVPVSAVGGVALPVLAGVLWLGERPAVTAWIGVAVAVPALWLVSHAGDGAGGRAAGTGDALIAGAGIAVQYLALAQSDPAAGIWPVVAGRVAAVLTLSPLLRGTVERPRPATVVWSLATRRRRRDRPDLLSARRAGATGGDRGGAVLAISGDPGRPRTGRTRRKAHAGTGDGPGRRAARGRAARIPLRPPPRSAPPSTR